MEGFNSAICSHLKELFPKEDILFNEPMSAHTTFKAGGEAAVLLRIRDTGQIVTLVSFLKKLNIPFFIKGNGSNLLVSDKGYDGIILEICDGMNAISTEGELIRAQSGALMSKIAKAALSNSLTGFEFASGIPGTIGGGVVMNAGAYDGELKDVIKSVTVLNGDGELMKLENKDMEFGYRTSIIKEKPFIVTEVELCLKKGDADKIKAKMDELNKRRREKQPLEYPSGGSTFKRPDGYFAGRLIMDTGLRGYSIGGAAVSEKHCGFVINKGNASASDIYEVITEVSEKVRDKFGVTLEPEIIFLGDF